MDETRELTLTARLTFAVPERPEEMHTQLFILPHVPWEGRSELLAGQIFAEIGKELRFGAHWDALAKVEDLSDAASRTTNAEELSSGIEFSIHNTQAVWREVTNTLLGTRYSLAQARGFHDIQNEWKTANADENDIANIHLSKLEKFDNAVFLLARVEDLFLLLLFVNLWRMGTSIVDVNFASPDWAKAISWKSVRKGLSERGRLPADVSETEHEEILSVLERYQRTDSLEAVANYRNRITHILHPSVDDVKFSASLSFPKAMPGGGTDMTVRWPNRPEFEFLALYNAAAEALSQVVTLLRRLKRIPRFA
jgi:hypothetical protein